jgi:hypothetical protein
MSVCHPLSAARSATEAACESLAFERHTLGSVGHREVAVWAELSLWCGYALSGVTEVCPLAPLPLSLCLRVSDPD